MGPSSGGGDPERQANIAFILVFLGIVFRFVLCQLLIVSFPIGEATPDY